MEKRFKELKRALVLKVIKAERTEKQLFSGLWFTSCSELCLLLPNISSCHPPRYSVSLFCHSLEHFLSAAQDNTNSKEIQKHLHLKKMDITVTTVAIERTTKVPYKKLFCCERLIGLLCQTSTVVLKKRSTPQDCITIRAVTPPCHSYNKALPNACSLPLSGQPATTAKTHAYCWNAGPGVCPFFFFLEWNKGVTAYVYVVWQRQFSYCVSTCSASDKLLLVCSSSIILQNKKNRI